MPGYISKLLDRLKHAMPSIPQHSPNLVPYAAHGSKMQLAKEEDSSPILDAKDIKLIESVVGAALHIG